MSIVAVTTIIVGTKLTAHYLTADAIAHSLHYLGAHVVHWHWVDHTTQLVAGSLRHLLSGIDPLNTDGMLKLKSLLRNGQLIAGALVIGTGGLMATIAGILRQIGLREEAMRRWKDVYWGTVMAMTGPALVFLVATIVRVLLPAPVL